MQTSDTESRLRAERMAILKRQWMPVVANIVAACKGDHDAAEQVSPFLEQLSKSGDWRDLIGVIGRILDGERDPDELLAGLDPTDTLIAGNVLNQLGVDLVEVVPGLIMLESIPEHGLPLADLSLVDFIVTALHVSHDGVDQDERDRVVSMTSALSIDQEAPEQLRALAGVLSDLLVGNPPELAALPADLRGLVTGLLASQFGYSGEPARA